MNRDVRLTFQLRAITSWLRAGVISLEIQLDRIKIRRLILRGGYTLLCNCRATASQDDQTNPSAHRAFLLIARWRPQYHEWIVTPQKSNNHQIASLIEQEKIQRSPANKWGRESRPTRPTVDG